MVEFSHLISAIDTHTAGEPTRIVLRGLPQLVGRTMAEKRNDMRERLDRFRTLLMQEPRGHRDMFGAVLTTPVTEEAQCGLIFMDHDGYLDMCGHGTIGAATALIETGWVPPIEPETRIAFDTPSGLVETRARIQDGRVVEVSLFNVSSFAHSRDVALDVPGLGRIVVDVSFGGNFVAMVPASAVGTSVRPENLQKLVHVAILIKRAVNEQISVQHPLQQHIARVELTEIYERPDPSKPYSKGVAVFGEGQVDRSPCGTGTAATMATLYSRGELSLGQEFTSESIIGTRFTGKLLRETRVGGFVAVEPVISGQAFLTGIQQFVLNPRDPLGWGLRVAASAEQHVSSLLRV
jgi:proline racemase/trans-L-3-hydroxyproline dehydratase